MANRNVILQWNCRGLSDKRLDLDLLISSYTPAIICLQETQLSSNVEKSWKDGSPLPGVTVFRGYTPYFKCIDSGKNGVAIYVRNNVIHSPIKLNTNLQALAVKVTFQDRTFIVSNHYTSKKHDGVPSKDDFKSIIDNFDLPFLMCGDFNGKNTLWNNDKDNDRGLALEEFMFENDLTLLNAKTITHLDDQTHRLRVRFRFSKSASWDAEGSKIRRPFEN